MVQSGNGEVAANAPIFELIEMMRLSHDVLQDTMARLTILEQRLSRLESSDFAKNRDEYEGTMRELASGMPNVPMFAD